MQTPNYSGRRASSPIWLLLIFIVAVALRTFALDSVPPGVNQDEAVHAYDAWCLLHTGADHFGERWPSFLRAVGDYHAAPFVYLLIPFQFLFGLNLWGTRLPAALLGVAGVWVLFAIMHRHYSRRTALLAALLLAVSAWHVTLSRLAFEVSICPTMLLMAVLLLQRGCGDAAGSAAGTRGVAMLVSGLVLGLCAWTYNAMRVFVPLLLLAGAIALRRPLAAGLRDRPVRRRLLTWLAGFLVGLAPFAYATLATPDRAWRRASTELRSGSADSRSLVATFLQTYALQLSPRFLFLQGDPSPRQCVPGYGQLHAIESAFIALGLLRVILRWRREPAGRLILLWLLIAPVPAALTRLDAGHALRSAAAIPALAALGALGLDGLLEFAAAWRPRLVRPLALLAMLGLVVSTLRFADLYFRQYPRSAAHAFEPEWRDIAREVRRRADDYDLILLSPAGGEQNGMLFLYHAAIPPSEYFAAPRDIQQVGGWDYLVQWDKFFFVPSTEMADLVRQLPPALRRPRILIAERPNVPVAGRELLRVRRPNGVEAMVLREVIVDRAGG